MPFPSPGESPRTGLLYGTSEDQKKHNLNALARNQTRVSRVGGENSTTEPRMPLKRQCLQGQEVYSGFSQVQASQALCLLDGLGFHPQPSAARDALCPLASCGLLWRALRCALAPSEWWNRWCSCSPAESCPTLCDPSDSSPPGSSVHGISTLLC